MTDRSALRVAAWIAAAVVVSAAALLWLWHALPDSVDVATKAMVVLTVVAAGGAIVSAVVAVVAFVSSGAARQEAARATALAERSTVASERSALAASDSAGASLRSADAAQYLVALKKAVRWSMRWEVEETYQLKNEGRNAAHDVRIQATELALDQTWTVVDGLSSVRFMAAVTIVTTDKKVHITWQEGEDPAVRSRYLELPTPAVT